MSTETVSTPVATVSKINLDAVKASFQVMNRAKVRTDMPPCEKMEKFISILSGAVPTWSEADRVGFKDLVSGQMPQFTFARFRKDLRTIAGLPVEEKRASSFEEAVRGLKALEEEVAQLRATIEDIKASLAKRKKA